MNAPAQQTAKKAWRGCGRHIPSAMAGVDEADWCACEPRVEVDGKTYPRAAPAAPLFGGIFGGGQKKDGEGKDEL
ncbi:hypothetical protein N0V82_000247 [Gnomoniopsis sp. IMI 355080]|nr:hypothetical protein N0V82_000247 [Gnomoniopsis sp. IMI 355080]